ncbi:MAG: hypothetical protein FK733_13240 [Asgard group archaeon]|nr:hypothetical protein [Asgard group archaeon]
MLAKNNLNLKLLYALSIFIGLAFIAPIIVEAHSPSSLQLSYNEETDTLTVQFFHQVPDNTTHYINKVEIWKNNILNITENYTSQPSTDNFNYSYIINATDGDELKVKATCNISGSLTRVLIVGETPTESVPASFVCITFLASLTLGGLIRRRNRK